MSNLIVLDKGNAGEFDVVPADVSYSGLIASKPTSTPSEVYVLKHSSTESRRVAKVKADHVAALLGYSQPEKIRWDNVNYNDAINLRATLMVSKNPRGELLSPATMNHTIIAFRQMAKIAWLMGIIDHEQHNVLRSVEPVRGSRRKIRDLPMTEDVEKLIDVCFQDPSAAGARDAALLTLAFGAGLRRSELVNLTYPDDILYRQSGLHVRGKGNKDRIMPLEDYMFDVLGTWINDVRGEYKGPLFLRIRKNDDIQAEKLTPAAVRFIMERRCLQAGIRIARPHDARSAYGTNLLNNGANLITVRNLFGHSSVTTTERYMQIEQDQMAQAVKNNLSILSSVKQRSQNK